MPFCHENQSKLYTLFEVIRVAYLSFSFPGLDLLFLFCFVLFYFLIYVYISIVLQAFVFTLWNEVRIKQIGKWLFIETLRII